MSDPSALTYLPVPAPFPAAGTDLMNTPFQTLRDVLRYAVSRFNSPKLSFGHGSIQVYDEAAYLLLYTLKLPLDRLEPFPGRAPDAGRNLGAAHCRTIERIPAAYLAHQA